MLTARAPLHFLYNCSKGFWTREGNFRPSTGLDASALELAIKLYSLLHYVLYLGAQLRLCGYFQVIL